MMVSRNLDKTNRIPPLISFIQSSVHRTLSAKGNPTLKTLLAVLKAVGMKLSVEPEHHAIA